jgi:TonB-dependent SusC/RagA subfamily outer membrane receptor
MLIRGLGIFLMSLCLLLSAAFAQGLRVSGTVVSNETGEPLPGAEIQLKGALIGTTADVDGKFELSVPDQTEGKIVVNYVGYVSLEVAVRATTSNLVLRLEEDILRGSEVVVTGVATSVKRRNLANAVGTISADELVPVPAQTLERALSGKIAGLRMTQNTGAPGGGIDVNLRGISTLTGTTQPLYVVDGVIIDNSAIQSGIDAVTQAAGVGSDNPQGQPTNRIADINPNDIENIEVLKGPSAAAIYGSKANNGVVIITTKQGALGKTKVEVSQKLGFTSILKKIGFRQYDAEKAEALQAGGGALFAKNGNIDYEELVYGQGGFLNETNLSIRGGTARTKFYVGGTFQSEDGIVQNTGYEKIGAKVNVTHIFSDRVNLSVFTNFTRTESDRSITGNENQSSTTLGFALAFTPSFVDIRAGTPRPGNLANADGALVYPTNAAGSNPLQTVELFLNNERNYRGLGSFRFNWNIFRKGNQSLDFITLGGVDFYSLENTVLSPPALQWERDKEADVRGESLIGETEATSWNLYYNLAHRIKTGSNIFTTSAGVQFEERDLNNVLNRALGIVPTQSNIDQASFPGNGDFTSRKKLTWVKKSISPVVFAAMPVVPMAIPKNSSFSPRLQPPYA